MSRASGMGLAAAALLAAAGCSSKSGGPTNTAACPTANDLISDFTSDNGVSQVDGRRGGWYTYGDKSGHGMLMPEEGGPANPDLTTGNPFCSDAGSLHVVSSGFSDWGSAMGVDFVASATLDGGLSAKGTYDATAYRGIAFWARAAAPIPFVQVSVLDPYTEIPSILPMDQQCVYDATMPTMNCSPYIVKFGYGYVGDAMTDVMEDYPKFIGTEIDTTWKRFEILFADMKQDRGNPGRQSPGNTLDVAQITGMAIQINTDHSTTPPTPTNYEMWLDDVSFVK